MPSNKIVFSGLFVLFSAFGSVSQIAAQENRPRYVPPTNQTANKVNTTIQQRARGEAVIVNSAATVSSRPAGARSVLTNDLLVRPTVSTSAANSSAANKAVSANSSALAMFRARMLGAMNSKLGIPYRYGSQGPFTYDCSGLVWTIFGESGVNFERASAATFWHQFEPVAAGDEYRFGTLVFFNGLKHVGVVIDENTFYHASSSQGVTFSSFEGYWGKRITGFRRVPLAETKNALLQPDSAK